MQSSECTVGNFESVVFAKLAGFKVGEKGDVFDFLGFGEAVLGKG
jgi:hypothetical protein